MCVHVGKGWLVWHGRFMFGGMARSLEGCFPGKTVVKDDGFFEGFLKSCESSEAKGAGEESLVPPPFALVEKQCVQGKNLSLQGK